MYFDRRKKVECVTHATISNQKKEFIILKSLARFLERGSFKKNLRDA